MKKLLTVFVCMAMMFSLAACSGQNRESGSKESAPDNSSELSESDGGTTDPDSSEASGAGDGKTLVVYYSATNHTEAVAGYIADATGGDLFEIEPKEPYTDDDLNWTDADSRVSKEHADESLREVELTSATVENWEDYDTVFIGYPIWWGIAAWPTDSFVKANDFTGKTVIPFCTSSSSGLGESGELLAEEAGTGNWLEGERFSSGVSEDKVKEWVGGLK